MSNKPRIGVCPGDEKMAKQVKTMPRRRTPVSGYCESTKEDRPVADSEGTAIVEGTCGERQKKLAFLARVERLRKKIGPTGVPAAELVHEGRRR